MKFFFFSLFPSPRHDFTTLSLLSAVSTLDYIFLRSSPRSFPFPILLFHHNFLSFAVPRSKLSIYSCKVRSKDSTPFDSTAFIYLPSLLPSPSFPFSHTFGKTRNRTNLQPPKKLAYASNAIRKNPVWRARSSIQKGNGYLLLEPSRTLSFRKFISPPRITRPDRNQIGRPILARDPKLFRFD